jgi:ABC-type Fe3+ transport system substrate-binding protein
MQDRRQLMDQLARGAYPICLTCKIENAGDLQNEGFHIHEVFDIEGMKNRLVSSPFLLTVVNKAPHPNATQIFVNWLATQEALEVYSRENKTATLRTDTDESFLDPRVVPKKDLAYFEAVDPQWIATGRKDATERMRETIKGSR